MSVTICDPGSVDIVFVFVLVFNTEVHLRAPNSQRMNQHSRDYVSFFLVGFVFSLCRDLC